MRGYIFDVPLDDYRLSEIAAQVASGRRFCQVFVNIHKINLFHRDIRIRSLAPREGCLFSVDGMWVYWFARLKGFLPRQRFGGLDVIETFCGLASARGYTVYLLGARSEVLARTKEYLTARFTGLTIVGIQDGFFADEEKIIEDIARKRPDIVFIALPSPAKELLGYKIFSRLDCTRYVTGVGGAFDILASVATRAPRWVQTIGCEWLYRCLQDPARLFRRYARDAIGIARIFINRLFLRPGDNR